MKKLMKTMGLAVASSLLFASVASAATFNYAAIADGVFAGTGPTGELGGATLTHAIDGISVNATGTYNGGSAFAYLDSGNAGMGVCKVLDGNNQCNPSSDDNVTTGEILTLNFSEKIVIDNLEFLGEGHVASALNGDSLNFRIDGGSWSVMSIDQLNWGNFVGLMGTTFDFAFLDENLGGDQFYVSSATVSAVPLPPAVLLFGAALGGLGFLSRRRKQAASA